MDGLLGFSYRFDVQQGTLVWMSSARKTGCGCAEDCNGTDTLECVAFRIACKDRQCIRPCPSLAVRIGCITYARGPRCFRSRSIRPRPLRAGWASTRWACLAAMHRRSFCRSLPAAITFI